MPTRSRPYLTVALALAAVCALSGCTSTAPIAPTPAATDTPPAAARQTPAADETVKTAAQPGTTVAPGQWMTYDAHGANGTTAVVQARVASITPATEAQRAWLTTKNSDVAGYSVSLVRIERRKVSGDTMPSDFGDFRPATRSGAPAARVATVGWDDCASDDVDAAFNDAGTTITSCVVALSKPDGDPVAGVLYTGSSYARGGFDTNPVFLRG